MKLFLLGLALVATVYGQYAVDSQYPQDSLAVLEEIETLEDPLNSLADGGYRYKTVKRLRHRHRRDVNELSSEYLPPVQQLGVEAPSNEYLAPIAPVAQEVNFASGVLADDGYRYKTVKRFRARHRRDVNELSSEYLPPVQQLGVEAPSNEYLAPIAPVAQEVNFASGVLADDGYRYKTVKRFRARHRRDVNELSSEYLPPVQQLAVESPSNEYLAPIAPVAQEVNFASGVLADDGYRYKTVKRFRARHRRDVNELSSEYLPPVQQLAVESPSNEYLAPIAPVAQEVNFASGVLADDGYRYKTVKRFRARHRRDVNELSSEYLPPVQQLAVESPSNEYLAPIAPVAQEVNFASGVLADDGYRYKTVKRFRARHRRDVNELSSEYLPPVQQLAAESPSNEYLAPIAPVAQEVNFASGVLADDGYRYKTVKRFRARHRRDVNELSSEYLPPVQQLAIESPSNEYLAPIAPVAQEVNFASGVLADDGYRYKTVKRFRARHRRDVNELPSAEYLPPVSAPAVADIPVISAEYLAPTEQNENILAGDGYRYKTVRRFKVRRH